MENILILDTGTQGLAMVYALKKLGYSVYLLSQDLMNYAGMSRYVDKKIYTNVPSKADSYADYLIHIIKEHEIDVIVPMSDASAHALSKHKAELQKFVKYKLPDYADFMCGYDKNQLMRLCRENGYPHPQTMDLSEVGLDDEALALFPFPALLKPNVTTGGRGMAKVNNIAELKEQYPSLHQEYGDYHLQQFIKPGGRQVKVQLYINPEKELIASSVIEKRRWYPVQGGSNCCAVSIYDQATIDLCHNILKDLNWCGFADFDLIENPDTHELLVMEINPRVPACIKSPIAAGVNWAQVIVEGYMNKEPTTFDYREGVVLRHLGLDVLWFIKSPNRWHTNPGWFKFFGKNVHYQDMSDWTDPMPFLCGSWRNIKNVISGHGKKAI